MSVKYTCKTINIEIIKESETESNTHCKKYLCPNMRHYICAILLLI